MKPQLRMNLNRENTLLEMGEALAEFTRTKLLPMSMKAQGTLNKRACEALIKGLFQIMVGTEDMAGLAMPSDVIQEMYLAGKSSKEISETTNIPENVVSQLIDAYPMMKREVFSLAP